MRLAYISIGIFLVIILLYILIAKLWTAYAVRKVKRTEDEIKIRRLDDVVRPFGFLYDPAQDMFYSRLHPWQRELGYEKAFDEGSLLFSMVIQCEPIYFEYDGKLWLIEFWKGQYGMTTGAEIGIYKTDKPADYEPGDERKIHYESVTDQELIPMEFVLRRGNEVLLKRAAKHWWLTAFEVGTYASPEELSMCLRISLPNERMGYAVYKGLLRAGYSSSELSSCCKNITVFFDKPKTKQPIRKYKLLRWLAQRNNRRNCRIYEKRTAMFHTDLDKITFLCYRYPLLYRALFGFTKWRKGH